MGLLYTFISLQAGFPSMEDCLKEAETLKVKSGGTLQCLKYYMMSSSPEIGLEYGLKHVKGEGPVVQACSAGIL